jgi:glucose/arabinose dehydrogenase/mono/diheme cytochrome c family protein
VAKHNENVSAGKFATILLLLSGVLVTVRLAKGQNAGFHDAPVSAQANKNPSARLQTAIDAGAKLYATNCASCHGRSGQGSGNVPSLANGPVQSATDGEVFWYITRGSPSNGMPAWGKLPEQQRWQIISYVKSLPSSARSGHLPPPETAGVEDDSKLPPPVAPFTDFRYEKPGTSHKITVADLPAPYVTKSSNNGPDLVERPANAWPIAPAGFKVQQFATGLDTPRFIRTAPNGDIFVAESDGGRITVFRGITADGKPEKQQVFASGLKRPYGIAFYPPGADPQWVYVGEADAIVRFPYRDGDLMARGSKQHLDDLPSGGGHWTRSIEFSQDGKIMFVSVGSGSNVDDPDTSPAEKNRADILAFNPDGSGMRVYASGIRNAGAGLAIDPSNGQLWCSANERDGLGDNLVPDYITHVQEGGFYGWPWWYIGDHQDPRLKGRHPELKDKAIVPDVLLQPHNASLEMAFYNGKQFPEEYQGDIFASQHGSWNRSVRVGYEVIRVPLHQTGKASGDYEDFLTGFVVDNRHVWGRPVGVAVAPDGSLLVSDDGSNSIWRVAYVGK